MRLVIVLAVVILGVVAAVFLHNGQGENIDSGVNSAVFQENNFTARTKAEKDENSCKYWHDELVMRRLRKALPTARPSYVENSWYKTKPLVHSPHSPGGQPVYVIGQEVSTTNHKRRVVPVYTGDGVRLKTIVTR